MAAAPTFDQQLEDATDAELVAMLEDAEGDAGACNDRECSCKTVPARIREEIEWRGSIDTFDPQ